LAALIFAVFSFIVVRHARIGQSSYVNVGYQKSMVEYNTPNSPYKVERISVISRTLYEPGVLA
jgi:hypothetical protein